MAKERPGMMLYFELLEPFKNLSEKNLAKLIIAMMEFSKDGIVPDFKNNSSLNLLWPIVAQRLADDKERYEEKRQKNIDAGNNSALIREIDRIKGNEEKLEQYKRDFETILEIYPKKDGKTQAFDEYLKWTIGRSIHGEKIKLTNREIYLAVLHYTQKQEQAGVEVKFYKNFASLLGTCLLDYQ